MRVANSTLFAKTKVRKLSHLNTSKKQIRRSWKEFSENKTLHNQSSKNCEHHSIQTDSKVMTNADCFETSGVALYIG